MKTINFYLSDFNLFQRLAAGFFFSLAVFGVISLIIVLIFNTELINNANFNLF